MSTAAAPGPGNPRRPGAVLIRDDQSCIPLTKILSGEDLLYVLTPAAVPAQPASPPPSGDPFEVFGRALVRHHNRVRHVPYIPRDGITDYHRTHINFAKVVIFVISGPPRLGQPSQVALSEAARSAGGQRPQIILACCSLRELGQIEDKFPTVIEISGYSRSELESAANLLFSEGVPRLIPPPPPPPQVNLDQQRWMVEEWAILTDLPTMHELWCQCLPDRFRLTRATLQSLLNQSGYAKNLVVRHPSTREVLGFCTTYTTFMDNSESLLGSLAVIIVKPSYRRRGIGRSLHAAALTQLKTHGVVRIQLGSSFPRLLYGLPIEMTSEDWFRRRGWRIDEGTAGGGQEACDWLLRMDEWNTVGLSSSGLEFRPCDYDDYRQVMEFVARESVRKDNMGWYDQYSHLEGTPHIRDIMLGFERGSIVATAITYIPHGGSRISDDLPWAATISDDVGGVACICITGQSKMLQSSRAVFQRI